MTFSDSDYLKFGEMLQRFWLKLTRFNWVMQPSYAPIIFSEYLKQHIKFSAEAKNIKTIERVSKKLEALSEGQKVVFAGRIGSPSFSSSHPRSVRKSLKE